MAASVGENVTVIMIIPIVILQHGSPWLLSSAGTTGSLGLSWEYEYVSCSASVLLHMQVICGYFKAAMTSLVMALHCLTRGCIIRMISLKERNM